MADNFVILDDAQFTRRDWRNRNTIKTPQGIHWLTIPVETKGKFTQKINETKVADSDWASRHWKTIKQNYSKAEGFSEYGDYFEELYHSITTLDLSEINQIFLQKICELIGIKTTIRSSRDFEWDLDRTFRLVRICKALGTETYLTGPAAKAYLDISAFTKENIDVEFLDYSDYIEYPQLFGPFVHQVSILDLLLNVGGRHKMYMKSFEKVIENGT
jgi:hypothetical protein